MGRNPGDGGRGVKEHQEVNVNTGVGKRNKRPQVTAEKEVPDSSFFPHSYTGDPDAIRRLRVQITIKAPPLLLKGPHEFVLSPRQRDTYDESFKRLSGGTLEGQKVLQSVG